MFLLEGSGIKAVVQTGPDAPAESEVAGSFVMILHVILRTRSHHHSLRAAAPDIRKIMVRALRL
jgi:hypothetical protein